MEFKEYISLFAIVISVISLVLTIYDRKIKVVANLSSNYDGYHLEIYNQGSRKITVSYFEIYSAKHKYFSDRTYAETWYNDAHDVKYIILPYEFKKISFDEEYTLDGFIKQSQNKHIYASIYVSGKHAKTIKLR